MNMTRNKRTAFLFAGLALAGLIAWLALSGGKSMSPSFTGRAIYQLSDGRIADADSFGGRYTLIYFGYTFCPDTCPTTMARLATAIGKLGDRIDDLQPLFITLDPSRDTPPVLHTYLAQFSPRITGLTPTPEQLAALEKDFHVYATKRTTGPGHDDYALDHSSVFYLMGKDGRFIAALSAEQDGDALAADIEKRMKE